MLEEQPSASGWQPTTRRAVQIANESVGGWRDDDLRLKVAGGEHVNDEEVLLRAFFGMKGDPDWAMLRRVIRTKNNENAAALADRIVRYLTTGEILDDIEVVRRAI